MEYLPFGTPTVRCSIAPGDAARGTRKARTISHDAYAFSGSIR